MIISIYGIVYQHNFFILQYLLNCSFMNKYFLSENGQHVGPFSIDELQSKNISNTELIWAEGMADWQQAGTIDELKSIFAVTPPPPTPPVTPPPPPVTQSPPPPPVTQTPPVPRVTQSPPIPQRQPVSPSQPQVNYTNQPQYNAGGYVPKSGDSWIIFGYIFSVVGGFLGCVIGTHLRFTKEKLPNGMKVKKYDEKSQQHGLIMLIIGGIFWIISLAIFN